MSIPSYQSIYPNVVEPSAPPMEFLPKEENIPFADAFPRPYSYEEAPPSYDFAVIGTKTNELISIATDVANSILPKPVTAPTFSFSNKTNSNFFSSRPRITPINIDFSTNNYNILSSVNNSTTINQAPKSDKQIEEEKKKKEERDRLVEGSAGAAIFALAAYLGSKAYGGYETVCDQIEQFGSLIKNWNQNRYHYNLNDNVFINNIATPVNNILQRKRLDAICNIFCATFFAAAGALLVGSAYLKAKELRGVAFVMGGIAAAVGLVRHGYRSVSSRDMNDAKFIMKQIEAFKAIS